MHGYQVEHVFAAQRALLASICILCSFEYYVHCILCDWTDQSIRRETLILVDPIDIT
jgi:hypothetical protein